ncbi:MAG TPA: alanine racemase [bacterium]|nr:alanine racemase [bacterium]
MRSWVEISRSAWQHNWKVITDAIQPAKPIAMIKANAYGHGLLVSAKLAQEVGIALLGVDSIEEAQQLRGEGIDTPIIIMGFIPEDQLVDLDALENVSITCYHREYLRVLRQLKRQVGIHLPIETGLSRQGITLKELPDFLDDIKKNDLFLEGLYSHLANVEDVADRDYTDKQNRELQKAIEILNEYKFDSVNIHLSASGAALMYPDIRYDYCRIGITQYGLWPSERIREQSTFTLRPVLSWKTRIAQIKQLKAGTPVSYGLTEVVEKDSVIAVLPIGYYDGFDREAFSSRAYVLIGGKCCKIIGRICMNMCMVDITNIQSVQVGDEVVLLGKQGDNEVSADELATLAKTIHYEIVTRISPHLSRIVVD